MSASFGSSSSRTRTLRRIPALAVASSLSAMLAAASTILPALAVAPSFLLAVPARAEPLTLESAQRRAIERSQLVRAQDASALASGEMAVAARQLPDPVVRIGIDNLPVEGGDAFSLTRDFMTMRRIGITQEFTRGDKRELRGERYQREAARSRAEQRGTVAQIARDTALAWLDCWYAEAIAAQLARQIETAEREIEAAEAAYRGGRASQADVISGRAVLAQLQDRSLEATKRVRTARAALARWAPDAASEPLADVPNVDALPLPAHALAAHVGEHPEIAVLNAQEEIAATEARLARATKQADWTWEIAFQQRGPAYSNMVSIGVSIPLQWDPSRRQDREAAAKLALVDEVRARREETARAHVAELQAMLVEWDSARARRAHWQRDVLPLAAARIEALVAAYRSNRATLGDVLAAERNEADARMQALQLELEIARAWAQLRFLVPDDALVAAAVKSARKESK